MDEAEKRRRMLCDGIIERAVHLMVDDVGVSIPTMLDRMLTYAAAQAVMQSGEPATAAIFRKMAASIDAGALRSMVDKSEDGSPPGAFRH